MALLTMVPGKAGGSETYVRGLLGAFAKGDGPETTTLLVGEASQPLANEMANERVEVARLQSYRSGDSSLSRLRAIGRARLLSRELGREIPAGLDLVHFPVTVPVPRMPNVPSIVTLHDLQHHDMPNLFSHPERIFRSWAYDAAARKADEVITITAFSAARITSRLGIPPERVHAIHLGVDHQRFHPDGGPASLTGLPDRYVFYPANAWPHKNHERLLEAFALVDDPDLHLVLTGSGHTQAADNKDRRVIRLGHVPAVELPGLYRGALALVFPSLYEGFGLPPLEAMACGCPVAASKIPPIAEVCGNSFVPFEATDTSAIAEAIVQVTTDAQLRSGLIESGLDHARSFTWGRTALAHCDVYRKALERR